jgi:hypothetical protein
MKKILFISGSIGLGHVFPFDPARYGDRGTLKSRLGYGTEPLVICSIGGTAGRLARHGAGVRMNLARTTPRELACAILANVGKPAPYPAIASDGAAKAAELICGLLSKEEEQ